MGDRLRALWDFDDLDGSERRLDNQLQLENSTDGRAEVLTQLARVQGLRGRLRRSSGEVHASLPLFEAAFEIAMAAGEEYLAADAAHMAALAATGLPAKLDWTERGIKIANASADRQLQYWLGPLYNNLGCEYMEAAEHQNALEAFEHALNARLKYPEMPDLIQHAKEAVAGALVALGREGEAGRV